MSEFIKFQILVYYRLKWNLPYLRMEDLPKALTTGVVFVGTSGRRKGGHYYYKMMEQILKDQGKEVVIVKKRNPESARGITPFDFLMRDKNGIPIDPDIGIMPDEIKKIWDAMKPFSPKNALKIPMVFGTGGEIDKSSKSYKDLWDAALTNKARKVGAQAVFIPGDEYFMKHYFAGCDPATSRNYSIGLYNISQPEPINSSTITRPKMEGLIEQIFKNNNQKP